ncbi:hypothetical protein DOY81_005438 [Sarcophaga bullata]|nr:hypothetical protein DOY81_005438 [Sarcophaga bullata]
MLLSMRKKMFSNKQQQEITNKKKKRIPNEKLKTSFKLEKI